MRGAGGCVRSGGLAGARRRRGRAAGQAPSRQRLQLVGLHRSDGARGLHQGDRHQGRLRHLRLQRHAGDQAARRQHPATTSWCRPPISSQRQIKAGVFQKLDKSEAAEPRRMPGPRSRSGSRFTIRAISTPSITCGARPASATTSRRRASVLGADGTIDSWDVVFKPESIAKFKDCGVHMLDSADDIVPAALALSRA